MIFFINSPTSSVTMYKVVDVFHQLHARDKSRTDKIEFILKKMGYELSQSKKEYLNNEYSPADSD